MQNIKIKLITGYRREQYHTIDADEAHKAYYLFLNPDKRGVFKNGVALIGQDIRAIEPDYQASMGWNRGYELTNDDWVEIRELGVDRKARDVLSLAREMAQEKYINEPLSGLSLPEGEPPTSEFVAGLASKLSVSKLKSSPERST